MSLHKEALAEANQLKEIAEQRAKNAIVESITPTIKKMIERKLLEASGDDKDDDDKDVLVDAARQVDLDALQAAGMSQGGDMDPSTGEDVAFTLPDEEGKVTLDLDALKDKEGQPVVATDENGEEVEITAEGLQALARMAGGAAENFGMRVLNISERLSRLADKKVLGEGVARTEKYKQLRVEVENLYTKLDESKMPKKQKSLIENRLESLYAEINKMYLPAEIALVEESLVRIGKKVVGIGRVTKGNDMTNEASRALTKTFRNMLKEVLSLNGTTSDLKTIAETVQGKRVCTNISKLYREIRRMARNILSEQDFTLMIKGLPEETEVDTLDVEVVGAAAGEDAEGLDGLEVGDEEGGDELDLDLDVGDEGAELEDEDDMESGLHEMDVEVDVDLPLDDEMGDELDLDAIDASLSPVGDEDMDMDLGDEGDMDMDLDMDAGEGDDMELDLGDDEMDLDEIVSEIEEMSGDDEMMESEDEVLEISESMLRRELKRMSGRRLSEEVSEEMIDPKADQFGGGHAEKEPFRDTDDSDMTTENTKLKSKLQKEARMNRALKGQLTQYKKHVTKLKRELAEQALFNEKIVHANKLLQNENLNPKVKLKIINALDGAESLTEVRKTYKTLVKALEKSKSKKNLSEGARVRGSASRPTKSGGKSKVITEGAEPELKRWSMLAGLDEK